MAVSACITVQPPDVLFATRDLERVATWHTEALVLNILDNPSGEVSSRVFGSLQPDTTTFYGIAVPSGP